jgi:hypothetical protein
MKRGYPPLAAPTTENPQIEFRAMTGEVENRTNTADETWVGANDGLKMVPALLFVFVQVAPGAGE